MFKSFTVALALLCAASVASGFVAGPVAKKTASASSSSLQMIDGESVKKAAASLVAATFVFGSVAIAPPAFATTDVDNGSLFGSSTEILAGRSGGRMGGRMGGGMRSSSSMRSRPSSTTRIINRNTYVTPGYSPPVVVSPLGYGYGYNPMGGLGLGLGLNAVGNIGNEIRDYRQEGEIRDTRMELERSKMREGELESRLRALEQQQGGQLTPQQLQVLQQIQAAQPLPAAPAAPAPAAK